MVTEFTKGAKMTMQQTKSTIIKSIGYNPLTEQLSVVLQTQPNTIFNYNGVSRGTADKFAGAKSKGQFFNRNIRGQFPSTKAAV
jgi:hypothetical protein